MTTLRYQFRSAILALCAMTVSGAPARAADCYSIGQQVAQQNGGTLARASSSTKGGQPVCVIVVLVPGKDGQRPRRSEFVVPQN